MSVGATSPMSERNLEPENNEWHRIVFFIAFFAPRGIGNQGPCGQAMLQTGNACLPKRTDGLYWVIGCQISHQIASLTPKYLPNYPWKKNAQTHDYCKNPKISDTGKFAVITLKVEQDGVSFALCIQKMQREFQTV